MLYPCCDGVVHDFCVIVGGESVAIRGGMEATSLLYNRGKTDTATDTLR